MRKKHTIIWVILLFSFSFIATTGISWITSYISHTEARKPSEMYGHAVFSWRCQQEKSFGGLRIKVDPLLDDAYYASGITVLSVATEMPAAILPDDKSLAKRSSPKWLTELPSQVIDQVTNRHRLPLYWRDEAYGWPFLCMKQRWVLTNFFTPFELEKGIRIKSNPFAITGDEFGLPVAIMPVPFLANSFCVFAALTTPLHVIIKTIRLIRRRRGQCVYCKYDVGSNFKTICPECGRSGAA